MGLLYLLLLGCAGNCSENCGCGRNACCGNNAAFFGLPTENGCGCGCENRSRCGGCGCGNQRSGGSGRCCRCVCECRCGFGRCGRGGCSVCNDADYYNSQYALGCARINCCNN